MLPPIYVLYVSWHTQPRSVTVIKIRPLATRTSTESLVILQWHHGEMDGNLYWMRMGIHGMTSQSCDCIWWGINAELLPSFASISSFAFYPCIKKRGTIRKLMNFMAGHTNRCRLKHWINMLKWNFYSNLIYSRWTCICWRCFAFGTFCSKFQLLNLNWKSCNMQVWIQCFPR